MLRALPARTIAGRQNVQVSVQVAMTVRVAMAIIVQPAALPLVRPQADIARAMAIAQHLVATQFAHHQAASVAAAAAPTIAAQATGKRERVRCQTLRVGHLNRDRAAVL